MAQTKLDKIDEIDLDRIITEHGIEAVLACLSTICTDKATDLRSYYSGQTDTEAQSALLGAEGWDRWAMTITGIV